MHAAKIPCRPFRLLLRRLAFRAGVRIVEVQASDLFSLGPRCAQLCSQQQWMVVQQSGGKTRARARLVSGSLQLETCLLPATQTFCFLFFFYFMVGGVFCVAHVRYLLALSLIGLKTLEKKTQHGSDGRASQLARAAVV